MESDFTQSVEFRLGFDAFCNHGRANVLCKKAQGGCESLSNRIAVNVARQTDVELDDVRPQIQNVPHAGITSADVINCNTNSLSSQRGQGLYNGLIITDGMVFCYLDHKAAGVEAGKGQCHLLSLQKRVR